MLVMIAYVCMDINGVPNTELGLPSPVDGWEAVKVTLDKKVKVTLDYKKTMTKVKVSNAHWAWAKNQNSPRQVLALKGNEISMSEIQLKKNGKSKSSNKLVLDKEWI